MIYVKPDEIVDVFYDEVVGSAETKLLAEDRENCIEVLMYDEDGYPKILVTFDGRPIDAISIDDPVEGEEIMLQMYKTYVDDESTAVNTNDPNYRDDLIREREREIEDAAVDFLSVVYEENINKTEAYAKGYLQEFVDHVLEWLYREQDVDIYRPMILVDENNEEFFEEYPYPCMEFD